MPNLGATANGFSPPAGILRCGTCHRTIECDMIDLLAFSNKGWPKCCDEVMALYTAVEKPATVGKTPNDTKFD